MEFTYSEFKKFLSSDESLSFPWERISQQEKEDRKLASPATNLGCGSKRFWLLLHEVIRNIDASQRVCDFGAYPGTFLRIMRHHVGNEISLAGAGFAFSNEFVGAMSEYDIELLEMEFDIRYPKFSNFKHILDAHIEPYDVAVCTEVIEHQMYPLSLLVGLNRSLKVGGKLYLTTNSVSFIGDILKLVSGDHNVESLERSHIVKDDLWRPHIRLYTLEELKSLLESAGFEVDLGFYFSNGDSYRGVKGMTLKTIKYIASSIPHMRSHIFIKAIKIQDPNPIVIENLNQVICNYDLQEAIRYSARN
jgi:2-polyprenyl-3-methyl-5-hydroxy-6-metoxy-1,4-benzoquinol methylase